MGTIPIAACCLTGGLVGVPSSDGGLDAGPDSGFGVDAGADGGSDAGPEPENDGGPGWWGDAGACMPGPATPLDSSLGLFADRIFAGGLSADLNGDGLLDLVSIDWASLTENPVEIFLGLPDGGLGEPQLITSEDETTSVATGDLNGDSAPDLLIARLGQAGYYIAVLINDRGNFKPTAALGRVTEGSNPVVQMWIADLDGDGRSDILYSYDLTIGDSNLAAANVIWGLADGGFSSPVPIAPFQRMQNPGFLIGDLNGDGRSDLIGNTPDNQHLQVLLNLGDGGFAITLYPNPMLGGIALLPNPDGPPDLVVGLAGYASDNTTIVHGGIEVMHNRGDGTFAPGPTFGVGGFSVVVGDFNGDCFPDIATSSVEPGCDPDGGIWVLYGDGEGGFGEPAELPVLNSNYVWLTALGPVIGPHELSATGSCDGFGLTLYPPGH